jgi:hypothetical protein
MSTSGVVGISPSAGVQRAGGAEPGNRAAISGSVNQSFESSLPSRECQRANLRRRRARSAFSRLAEPRREGAGGTQPVPRVRGLQQRHLHARRFAGHTSQTDARPLGNLDADEERIEERLVQVVMHPGATGTSPGRGRTRFGERRAGRNREGPVRGEKRFRRHPSAVGAGRARAITRTGRHGDRLFAVSSYELMKVPGGERTEWYYLLGRIPFRRMSHAQNFSPRR